MKFISNLTFLILLLIATIAIPIDASAQQTRTISGVVLDENSEPVIGASVAIPGTPVGIATNIDGKFDLTVPTDKTSLQINYLGYQPQTVVIGNGQTNLTIKLIPADKLLDEVVIVGYGSQRVKDLTGAATPVQMDEIANLPGASIIDALAGQVIGLSVTKSSGRPGATGSFKIREPAPALTGGVSYGPLIVIDDIVQVTALGEPDMTTFNMLDHSEIESMTVLKDASAAIYGSRASQGVILVKTKRGQVGTPKITYSAKLDFSDAVSHAKVMNAYETGVFTNRMFNQTKANGGTNYDSFLYSNDELNAMKNLNYDWMGRAWQPALSQRHSLSINGGTDKLTYFAGITYQDQETNLGSVQDFGKWTFRTGGEMKVTAGLKLSVSIAGYNSSTTNAKDQARFNSGPWGDETPSHDYPVLRHMPKFIPMEVAVKQETGEFKNFWTSPWIGPHYVNTNTDANVNTGFAVWNFFANDASKARKVTEENGYNANFSLIYEVPFIKGLSLKGTYAVNYDNTTINDMGDYYKLARATNTNAPGQHLIGDYTTYNYIQYGRSSNLNNQPSVIYTKSTRKSEQMNFMLNYDRTFGNHDISLMGVVERAESEGNSMQLLYRGPWDSYNGVSSSAGTLSTSGGDTYFGKSESGALSYVGRFNYKYGDRYLAQFLVRSDASTKFAPENYWGTFPTGSVGWVPSEENFFKNSGISKYVNYLKLRYSLGKTGKDNVKAWSWMPAFTVGTQSGIGFGSIDGAPTFGAVFNGTVNRNIKWDTTVKENFGLDLNVLSNRLGLSVDYFYDKTKDLIMRVVAAPDEDPIYLGASLPYLNYGKANGWGWEFSLRWNDKIKQGIVSSWGPIHYSVGMDYGISWNEVVLGETYVFDYPSTVNNAVGRTGHINPDNQYGFKVWKNTSQGDGMLRTQEDIDNYWQYLTDLATAAGNTPAYFSVTSKANMRLGMLAYQDIAGDIDVNNKTIAGPNGVISRDHGQDYTKLADKRRHNINTKLGFQWGNFNWTAQLATSWGGYSMIYSDVPQAINTSTMIWAQFSYVNDMFDPTDNPNGKFPSMAVSNAYGEYSDFWTVPNFRCYVRNMTIAYSLPKNLLKKARVDKLQIGLTGNNLWDFYNPYPDKFRNMYDDGRTGYPTLRTWTLSANFTF
ncbi:SusC/RagA family TonB-linked outer membrane protein [Bacteroidia bacterium]|nr:SusC/RagA family TonB-linked outer membrane protein [Bacteroidia bacterium]